MDHLLNLDRELFLFLNGLHCQFLDPVMWLISSKLIWLPLYALIIYFIIRKRKSQFWVTLIIIALMITSSDQVAGLIKDSVKRPRPTHNPEIENLVHVLKDSHGNYYRGGMYGFVSNHAANSFAVAAFVSLFFARRWITISIILWALVVSYSRIYLGVHYPFDILCGGAIGATIGILMFYIDTWIVQKIIKRKNHEHQN